MKYYSEGKQEGSKIDVLSQIAFSFSHPAVILWRTIEIKRVVEIFAKYLPQPPFLDLGCGEGRIAQIVFGQQKVDVGLDNCPEMAKRARNSGAYRKVILGDACKMPFFPEIFNTVFSNSVIEHIKNVDTVLQEIRRILKPGGLFIVTVPSEKFGEYLFFYRLFRFFKLTKLAQWYSRKRCELLNHYHCYNAEIWQNRLSQAGLTLIQKEYYLKKSATSLWDILAAIGFVWRKISFWNKYFLGKKLSAFVNRKTSKLRVSLFCRILLRHSGRKVCLNGEGAGLLMIARKD